MRISDWSSCVCSSDLHPDLLPKGKGEHLAGPDLGGRPFHHPPVQPHMSAFTKRLRHSAGFRQARKPQPFVQPQCMFSHTFLLRSEAHTSELQSLMRISYAVFCLKNKKQNGATP